MPTVFDMLNLELAPALPDGVLIVLALQETENAKCNNGLCGKSP